MTPRKKIQFLSELRARDLEINQKSSSLEHYWEEAHRDKNSYWTSAKNTFQPIAEVLKIPTKLEGLSILVVGVGEGAELFGGVELGGDVAGLDISVEARNKFVDQFKMYDWNSLSGVYDEIWIHLVVQHMSDLDLKQRLIKLREHSKLNTKLRIQFATPYHSSHWRNREAMNSLDSLKSGSNIRGLAIIQDMLLQTGWNIIELRCTGKFKKYKSSHATVIATPTIRVNTFRRKISYLKFIILTLI
jgi:hypothetical protein